MIAAVVAVDENWGIGFNGELLERIPEDLKFFNKLTEDKKDLVVMGRNTFNSLKKKKYLYYRNCMVISHRGFYGEEMDESGIMPYPNRGYANIFATLDAFKKKIRLYTECIYRNTFIIGGGQIYKELLPFCDRVYVTKIFKSHDNVDTYFPNLDEPEEWNTWKPVEQSEVFVYNDIMYQFWIYDRIN